MLRAEMKVLEPLSYSGVSWAVYRLFGVAKGFLRPWHDGAKGISPLAFKHA